MSPKKKKDKFWKHILIISLFPQSIRRERQIGAMYTNVTYPTVKRIASFIHGKIRRTYGYLRNFSMAKVVKKILRIPYFLDIEPILRPSPNMPICS